MWTLTYAIEDDENGEYIVTVFADKPTEEELLALPVVKHLALDSVEASSLVNKGSHSDFYRCYYLRKVVSGQVNSTILKNHIN
jgi:hypothetical protein